MRKIIHHPRVNPDVEYIVHDINDVVVAIVAHKEDADILARVKGYGWRASFAGGLGTVRVGEDVHRALPAEARAERGLKPRNDFAVVGG